MGSIENKLEKIGLKLPEIPKPVAAYIPAKQSGKLVFTAGQLPMVNGELISKGLLGQDVEVDEANKAARICTLNALAANKVNGKSGFGREAQLNVSNSGSLNNGIKYAAGFA